jgi:hypothetical protein
MKYNPIIPIISTAVLTQRKRLQFSDHRMTILSTAAHLESESFVIGFGYYGDFFVDIFTPAQAFDALSKDFNYAALVLLLLGLLAAVLALRHFNQKTTLNRLWH